MLIKDVMTRGVQCVGPEASLQETAARMQSLDVGSIPVCDHDRLVGMVTDRDIAVRAIASARDPVTTRACDVMTPRVIYCYEDEDVAEASRLMETAQVRRVLVLSRDKRLVGIVSLGDLAVRRGDDRSSGQTLEQVSEPAAARH